jgi:hypothetical protein
MMKNKTRKQRTAIVRGFFVLVIGLIIGIAYLFKFFPLDPKQNVWILAAWAYTGWMFAALAILYGLCEILIEGDL